MQAITIIKLCAKEYNDAAYARIAKEDDDTKADWLSFLNDAQRTIALVVPAAAAVTESVELVAGAKQTLPAGGMKLLDANRNTGTAGTSNGLTIHMGERATLDAIDRSWQSATQSNVIDDVLYDEKRDPLVYWVSPPAKASPKTFIEIVYSKSPTALTDADTDAIGLADLYAGPMQQWMLFRAYALATQAQNQFQRAVFHFQSFFNILGVKARAEMFAAVMGVDLYKPTQTP